MKRKQLRHNSAGIYLPKKAWPPTGPHLLMNRHYRGWSISVISPFLAAPAAVLRMLALLLVVFSGISPNGVARRLRFGSPVNQ